MDGMYDIAAQVAEWLAAGQDVRVATVVAARGFSSQLPAASAAWTDGSPAVGTLGDAISPADVAGDGLLEVTISADDAARRGLACGGSASILVRSAAALPAGLWELLVAREPLCLVTSLPGGDT